MSFIDQISNGATWSDDNRIGNNQAAAAITSYLINKTSNSVNSSNSMPDTTASSQPDYGVRLQVPPDTENRIPVVYGQAFLGGIISDAQLSNNNKTMNYCLTICEKTGVKFSDSLASEFTFKDIFWNDQRIVFKEDAVTIDYTVDRNGTVDKSTSGFVRIYCFAGNSNSPVVPENYINGNLSAAYFRMPDWDILWSMNDLIFAIVQVDYNKDRNLTGIGNIKFQIQNSMTLPGDVIWDYMTNSRYGAGIKDTEIFKQ
jgi:hypothetical protein